MIAIGCVLCLIFRVTNFLFCDMCSVFYFIAEKSTTLAFVGFSVEMKPKIKIMKKILHYCVYIRIGYCTRVCVILFCIKLFLLNSILIMLHLNPLVTFYFLFPTCLYIQLSLQFRHYFYPLTLQLILFCPFLLESHFLFSCPLSFFPYQILLLIFNFPIFSCLEIYVGTDAANDELKLLEGELSSVQELKFAFRRAASRMTEMAGKEYLNIWKSKFKSLS